MSVGVYLTIFLYILLGAYLFTRPSWTRRTGLDRQWLLGLWLVKALAGLGLCWLYAHYYPDNDYSTLNREGWFEYESLTHTPKRFFTDWIQSPYADKYGGFFDSVGSYWNDLRNTLLSKVLAFANTLNRGNIYSNTLLFCCISFLGHLAFYRLMTGLFPGKKWPAVVGCFLLPSMLFFSSGLHKDAIVFTCMGVGLLTFYTIIEDKLTLKRGVTLFFGILMLWLMRNYVCLVMIPVCLAWIIAEKKRIHPMWLIGSLMIAIFVWMLCADIFFPTYSPIKILVQKQADFLALPPTASALPVQKMDSTLKSVVFYTPKALEHAYLRPFIWDEGGFLMNSAALELFGYQLLFILMLFLQHRSPQTNDPGKVWVMVSMSALLILFVGYISPNAGTLVRYRSLYLPLLITPMLCMIKWKRFSF